MADLHPSAGAADATPEGALTPSDIEAGKERIELDEKEAVHPRKNIATWKWILTLVGLYLGALLYGLDTTIAADVQAPVYESLGEIQKLPWIGLGFPMASVAVILLTGRLFGLFDIKWMILSYIFLFEVGSAICGAAPTADSMIIGRVIAGVGGAGMYIGALTYISVYSTLREMTLYNALIGMSWGVGAILGPIIGGAFSESSATWRWAFYINLPLMGVLTPVYLFIFPNYNPQPDVPRMQKILSIDWVGAFLNAGVFVFFMVVVTFSGSLFAWDSATSIALWVVWGVFLIAFIAQQGLALFTTTERRIFPVHFLKSRTLVLLYVATGCGATAVAVTLYYVPLFFQFTRGDNALDAAIRLLPFICVYIFFVMVAGALLPMVGWYAPWYTVGGALIIAGGALMYTIGPDTTPQQVYGYEVLIAIGSGLMFQNAYAVASAKVADVDKPNAIGFINVSQIGTIAIALAMAGSLFQNLGFSFLKDALSEFNLPDGLLRTALAGTGSAVLRDMGQEITRLAISAVADTISRIFALVLAGGAVLFVSSFLMKWEKVKLDLAAAGG